MFLMISSGYVAQNVVFKCRDGDSGDATSKLSVIVKRTNNESYEYNVISSRLRKLISRLIIIFIFIERDDITK